MQASIAAEPTIIRLVAQTKSRFCMHSCIVMSTFSFFFFYFSVRAHHSH